MSPTCVLIVSASSPYSPNGLGIESRHAMRAMLCGIGASSKRSTIPFCLPRLPTSGRTEQAPRLRASGGHVEQCRSTLIRRAHLCHNLLLFLSLSRSSAHLPLCPFGPQRRRALCPAENHPSVMALRCFERAAVRCRRFSVTLVFALPNRKRQTLWPWKLHRRPLTRKPSHFAFDRVLCTTRIV